MPVQFNSSGSESSNPPAGETGDVQLNIDGNFGAVPGSGFNVDQVNGLTLTFADETDDGDDTTFRLGSRSSSVMTFINSDDATVYGAIRSDASGSFISSNQGLQIEVDIFGADPQWNFNMDGSLQLPNLSADPTSPAEGSVWYRSDTHQWRGFDGTSSGTFTFVAD